MDTIIAASRNQHKIVEIEAITKKFGMTIISRDEAGIPKVEIEEDGETFEENSFKKPMKLGRCAARRLSPMIPALWSTTSGSAGRIFSQICRGRLQ